MAAPVLSSPDKAEARQPLSLLRAIPVSWHLLSLDAPTVAVVWACAFLRSGHVRGRWGDVLVLGLGTWLLYVIDRLLDVRPGSGRNEFRDRHVFHARHWRGLCAACACAAPVLLWLIGTRMSAQAREGDAIVFLVCLVYFAVVHLGTARPRAKQPGRFSRECAIGMVFAAGTALPLWAQGGLSSGALWCGIVLFGALCSLNCIAIDSWENQDARARTAAVAWISLGLAAAAAILMVACAGRDPEGAGVAACVFSSALLLFALDLQTQRNRGVSLLALRIAADAVLLTPLLLILPAAR